MLRVGAALLLVALAYPLGILLLADQGAFGGAVIVGTFTVGASFFIGAPLAFWCMRRGWLSAWHAVLAGSLAGLICSCVFLLGSVSEAVNFAVPFVLVGAVHGLAFWVLAFWHNSRIRRAFQATHSKPEAKVVA
jgi:hypothetical protein